MKPTKIEYQKLEAAARGAAANAADAKKHWQHMADMAEYFPGMDERVAAAESRCEQADAEMVRTRNAVWNAA